MGRGHGGDVTLGDSPARAGDIQAVCSEPFVHRGSGVVGLEDEVFVFPRQWFRSVV